MIDADIIQSLIEEIKILYKNNQYPWVLGYSGGKDSSCTLQLVWQAISELKESERTKPIFIIYTDTLVDIPIISKYLERIKSKIEKTSKECNLPISIHAIYPEISNTFWVNLIGKGYPAPKTKFRWCTDRLKIEPVNKFILERVSEFGEVIMVLGARKAESASRSQVINKRQSQGSLSADAMLTKHSTLNGAYVYTPISEWETDDVWKYLLANPHTPWGSSNRELFEMYADAQGGECPMVVDANTPPCGNSRFGCWVCTLVEDDKSLRSIVERGAIQYKPLLEYRKMLFDTTIPENKAKYRSYKRRTGKVNFTNTDVNKIIRGPYKFEFRKQLLKHLLEIQLKINNTIEDKVELIKENELRAIRDIWAKEENDWVDSVPQIYKEVTGMELRWVKDDIVQFGENEINLLEKICNQFNIPVSLVARLIDKERQFNGLGRRNNLIKELDSILKEEWRDEKEIMKERLASHDNK